MARSGDWPPDRNAIPATAAGTVLELLGFVGRGDELVAAQPLPMRTRPPSNYHWRSNPYAVDSPADGSELLSGADFRLAYWMARFMRR